MSDVAPVLHGPQHLADRGDGHAKKSLAKAIREVLAHEYGHHIRQTEDEGIADFVGDMILNRTGGCA